MHSNPACAAVEAQVRTRLPSPLSTFAKGLRSALVDGAVSDIDSMICYVEKGIRILARGKQISCNIHSTLHMFACFSLTVRIQVSCQALHMAADGGHIPRCQSDLRIRSTFQWTECRIHPDVAIVFTPVMCARQIHDAAIEARARSRKPTPADVYEYGCVVVIPNWQGRARAAAKKLKDAGYEPADVLEAA